MALQSSKLTEEQVQAFALGEVVELNAPQLTAIVRYMAKNTPIAIISVGDRLYRAVSIRRTLDGDKISEALLGITPAAVDSNTGEVRIALDHIQNG